MEQTQEDWVVCCFCNNPKREVEARRVGWVPYFYTREIEHGPACPSCASKHLVMGIDGEWEIKSRINQPLVLGYTQKGEKKK